MTPEEYEQLQSESALWKLRPSLLNPVTTGMELAKANPFNPPLANVGDELIFGPEREENLREWFGESQARTETGEPLRTLHGTTSKVSPKFDQSINWVVSAPEGGLLSPEYPVNQSIPSEEDYIEQGYVPSGEGPESAYASMYAYKGIEPFSYRRPLAFGWMPRELSPELIKRAGLPPEVQEQITRKGGPHFVPTYVKAENPYDVGDASKRISLHQITREVSRRAKRSGVDPERVDKAAERYRDKMRNYLRTQDTQPNEGVPAWRLWQNNPREYRNITYNPMDHFADFLKETGFDSIKAWEGGKKKVRTWGLLAPTQLKSPHNVGTFDPEKEDYMTRLKKKNGLLEA